MSPNSCKAIYNQPTPTPNWPRPKRNPRHAARAGVALDHRINNTAGANTASGNNSRGAKASGNTAPATRAVRSDQPGLRNEG